MNDTPPKYGEYERKGTGGPEGKCLVCAFQGPMDHGMTAYECAKCHSPDLVLKLKPEKDQPAQVYRQMMRRREPAPA